MSKRYGLILPGEQEKSKGNSPKAITKSTIFGENSSDEDSDDGPQRKPTSNRSNMSSIEQKISKRLQQKALNEDPTIFQYDELYDDMDNKRNEDLKKDKKPKESKYIGRLLECAEKRKLQYELRIERQIQKEREAEGEQFKDKESFVTSAYRKKLEDIRKLEEEDKRDEYLEAIGDVTKQKDLDGFYRHIYEQKTSTTKGVEKPELKTQIDENKDEKTIKQRKYRKRHTSDEENMDDDNDDEDRNRNSKIRKTHLQNNMDADSDFSIDTSSSSSESIKSDEENDNKNEKLIKNNERNGKHKIKQIDEPKKTSKNQQQVDKKEQKRATSVDNINGNGSASDHDSDTTNTNSSTISTVADKQKEKPKIDVWKKRTVGGVYAAALQRFYERKFLH